MILVITPSARAGECAQAIESSSGRPTRVASNLQDAGTKLRAGEYAAVIVDQFLLDAEPGESEQMLEHLGTAIPVCVNFAISPIDRVVREVKTALSRRQREEQIARRSAEQTLLSERKERVTAMLLSCDMALAIPGLPEAAVGKIQAVHELTCASGCWTK